MSENIIRNSQVTGNRFFVGSKAPWEPKPHKANASCLLDVHRGFSMLLMVSAGFGHKTAGPAKILALFTPMGDDLLSFLIFHAPVSPHRSSKCALYRLCLSCFFFKSGDRFTAHQHLDNGHFLIYRGGELAADGGQYYYFGTDHDVNYHLRTVAHSTLRVYDPQESWHNIRAFEKLFNGVMDNDGGQHHDFPHHNGAVEDAAAWNANRELYEPGRPAGIPGRGPLALYRRRLLAVL